VGIESWNFQSGKSNECEHARDFDSPQTKPVVAEVPFDVIDHFVALASRETAELWMVR
jgi:hypothetical protein